jgi:hypothetical protein
MRHLIGIVLAIIMAGAVFFAGAWGYLRLLRISAGAGLPASGGALLHDRTALIAMAAVAATGLLAGILIAAPRISPLAAALPGLVLAGWTALYLVNVRFATDLIPMPARASGTGFRALLESGILGAAGLAMVFPLFVPSRWRRRSGAATEAIEADDYLASLTSPFAHG